WGGWGGTGELVRAVAEGLSSNQSSLAGVTLTRRKRSVKRLNLVAFRSSTACLKSSGVNFLPPQTSQARFSPLPLRAWNTRPSKGNCSIFSMFCLMYFVSGSSQPHSMSFFPLRESFSGLAWAAAGTPTVTPSKLSRRITEYRWIMDVSFFSVEQDLFQVLQVSNRSVHKRRVHPARRASLD